MYKRQGDGSKGWLEHSPFDVIISWVKLPEVSFELMSQMDLNARLIAPVGEVESRLVLFENTDDGVQQYALEEFII